MQSYVPKITARFIKHVQYTYEKKGKMAPRDFTTLSKKRVIEFFFKICQTERSGGYGNPFTL